MVYWVPTGWLIGCWWLAGCWIRAVSSTGHWRAAEQVGDTVAPPGVLRVGMTDTHITQSPAYLGVFGEVIVRLR